jgi:hypothetical protein
MTELISIREASRRLGVSDTAVHKAIKVGRVKIAGRTPGTDRPLVAWPQVETDWLANSDAGKRTHVGSRGSPIRAKNPPPQTRLPTNTEEADQPPAAATPGTGPSLATSRAVREAYQARLAKLEWEQKVGKLVEADQVKVRAFNMARAARDALMTMPDRLAPILASSTDVIEVHRLMLEDIERTCQQLAQEAARAA